MERKFESFANLKRYKTLRLPLPHTPEFESFANLKRYKTAVCIASGAVWFESFANLKRYKTDKKYCHSPPGLRALLI